MTALAVQAAATLDTFRLHPEAFIRDVLGANVWSADIVRAMARPRARVAVKACHSSGKTWLAAQIVLWWVATGGKSVTTAPTWTQVRQLLWGEIHSAYHRSRVPFGGELNQAELRLAPDVYALGLSTNEGVKFQGFHGDVLVVLDEAPGVRPDIWDAIEGIRASGDVRVLALGNPTVPAGPFYDAFSRDLASWDAYTISAFDTPNLRGLTLKKLLDMPADELDKAERPYLVTRRWVREKLDEWGPDSASFQARVLGQFPKQSEDHLYALAWLENARNAEWDSLPEEPIVAGVDVAGPGDAETVAYVRQGSKLLALPFATASPEPRGELIAYLSRFGSQLAGGRKGMTVMVDSIGIGYYLAKHLEDSGFKVVQVNVGEPPRDKERFANLKAEVCWGLRMRLEKGELAGLVDELTISQLASIKYNHNARGQIVIEAKDAARKRGVKSPDRAEALILAFAQLGTGDAIGHTVERQVGGRFGGALRRGRFR